MGTTIFPSSLSRYATSGSSFSALLLLSSLAAGTTGLDTLQAINNIILIPASTLQIDLPLVIFQYFFNNNGVVSCLPFAPLDTNWRLHCIGLTLLIDKYVDAKIQKKNSLVKRQYTIDTERNIQNAINQRDSKSVCRPIDTSAMRSKVLRESENL